MGRKIKEDKKDKRFLSYRVNDEEKEFLEDIFQSYKKKYNLKSTEAIFKIMETIKEVENL